MRLVRLALVPALALAAGAAAAQEGAPALAHPPLRAAGEAETYLRVLQTAGIVPLHPWSVRGFSPREGEALAPRAEHPWERRYAAPARVSGLRVLPAAVDLRYSSAFPHGAGDGAVWAGRGATVSGSAGVSARAGVLSAQLAPEAFWSENRGFALRETHPRASEFANPRSARFIDLPQRFGDGGYGRVDPGESFLRLDVGRLAAGVSSAVQAWGPADRLPLILGADGPGLPHVFVGSATPVNVGVGRLHGRVVWGDARQSEFTTIAAGEHGSRRFVSGVVAVFTPAFVPGLEVGGARFYHLAWPAGGLGARDFAKIFDPFTKSSLPDVDGSGSRAQRDNQLLSVFARWVLPSAGLEVWGEYGREDHSWDLLDLYLEPDQQAAYTLGARKVWARGDRVWAARGEVLDAQVSHLLEVRDQHPFHRHAGTPQGHTHHGQPLGASSAHGGGGWVLGLDRYGPAGRTSLDWTFARVDQRWSYDAMGVVSSRDTDVRHAVELGGVRFAGLLEVLWGVGTVLELNRHFARDEAGFFFRLGGRVSGIRSRRPVAPPAEPR